MLKGLLQRITGKAATRNIDAGTGGRRWSGIKTIAHQNSAILAAGRTVFERVGYMVRNDPWAAAAVSNLVANIVGDGIKPQSQHPTNATRERLNRMFQAWAPHADSDGLTDFCGLQSMAVRAMIEGGECFVRMVPRAQDDRSTVPLSLELIAADQVPNDLTYDTDGGRRIRAGIEFSREGKRLAYHVFKHRQDEFRLTPETVRIPASEMLHLFEPLVPGQVRGLSRLSPVLLRLLDLQEYEGAEAVRKKTAAMFAGFVTRPDPDDDLLNEDDTAPEVAGEEGVAIATLEPGTMQLLEPGEDVKFSDPADVGGNYEAFMKHQLRAIAAGVGVTYEQLTGDLTGVNFSSIRAGLIEFRRRNSQLQRNVVIPRLCRPVWERFMRLAILSGYVNASEFDRAPHDFLAAKWITPKQDWVDPLKDAQAAKLAIDEGFMSRREVVAARGLDIESLDEEVAADSARAKRLGLDLGGKKKGARTDA